MAQNGYMQIDVIHSDTYTKICIEKSIPNC